MPRQHVPGAGLTGPDATTPNPVPPQLAPYLFKPGVSANPGGVTNRETLTQVLRRKVDAEELADGLLALTRSPWDTVRLPAIKYVYDRIEGTPVQHVEVDDDASSAWQTLQLALMQRLAGHLPIPALVSEAEAGADTVPPIDVEAVEVSEPVPTPTRAAVDAEAEATLQRRRRGRPTSSRTKRTPSP